MISFVIFSYLQFLLFQFSSLKFSLFFSFLNIYFSTTYNTVLSFHFYNFFSYTHFSLIFLFTLLNSFFPTDKVFSFTFLTHFYLFFYSFHTFFSPQYFLLNVCIYFSFIHCFPLVYSVCIKPFSLYNFPLPFFNLHFF